jgi:hypothetical protein
MAGSETAFRFSSSQLSGRSDDRPCDETDSEVQATGCGRKNGQGGIRTHDTLAGIPVFEANAPKAEIFGESGNAFEPHPVRLSAKAKRMESFVKL